MVGCKLHHLVAQMALVMKQNAGLSISERVVSIYYVLDIVRIQRKYKTNFPSPLSLQSNYEIEDCQRTDDKSTFIFISVKLCNIKYVREIMHVLIKVFLKNLSFMWSVCA